MGIYIAVRWVTIVLMASLGCASLLSVGFSCILLGMFRSIIYFKRFCGRINAFKINNLNAFQVLKQVYYLIPVWTHVNSTAMTLILLFFKWVVQFFFSPRVKLKALSKTRTKKKYHIIQNNRWIIVLQLKLKILSHLFLSKHYLHRNGTNPELKCDIIYVNCRVRIKPSRIMNRLEQLYL